MTRIRTVKGNRDLQLLLFITAFYGLATAISNLFVNLLLWRQSKQLHMILNYNFAVILSQMFFYWLAGILAKRLDRVLLFRMGIVILALFYVVILWLRENASAYTILLGAILGCGYGVYWLSYHLLTFEITEPTTRDYFNGMAGLFSSIANLVGPFGAGWVIEVTSVSKGYFLLFLVSLGLFLLAILCSWFLHRRPKETTPYALHKVWTERKRNLSLRRVLTAHIAQGWREGGILFLIILWVFTILQRERSVGLFMLLQSLFSLVLYFAWGRGWMKGHRWKYLFWGGLTSYLGIVALFFSPNPMMVYAYAILIGIAYPLIDVPYRSSTYDIIGTANKAGPWRIEYLQLRDLYTNLGRMMALLLLFFMLGAGEMKAILPWYAVLTGGGYWFISWLLVKQVE